MGKILLLVALLAGCSSPTSPPAQPAPGPTIVRGPLCAALPSGDSPGAPALLTQESADVALTWIPVLTTFEAAVRATGLDATLRDADALTILAPTDEAFAEALSEETLDALILSRQDELEALLRAHILEGAHTVDDLLSSGSATPLAGEAVAVVAADDGMARLDDRAQTVCADYEVANARIHVIDGVLGELPEPEPEGPEGN